MAGRALDAATMSHIDTGHTHPTLMAKMMFDTPSYAHTGLGNIIYDGNTYLGLGKVAGVAGLEESESLVPAAIRLSLNGLDPDLLAEVLDSSTFGSRITLMIGYRQDDGLLVPSTTPWIFYKGRVENADSTRGKNNSISITIQHDLAVLSRKVGSKYTNEEQQRRYPGDTAFQHIEKMATITKQLNWGVNDPGFIRNRDVDRDFSDRDRY
jgi:hypothetical protein